MRHLKRSGAGVPVEAPVDAAADGNPSLDFSAARNLGPSPLCRPQFHGRRPDGGLPDPYKSWGRGRAACCRRDVGWGGRRRRNSSAAGGGVVVVVGGGGGGRPPAAEAGVVVVARMGEGGLVVHCAPAAADAGLSAPNRRRRRPNRSRRPRSPTPGGASTPANYATTNLKITINNYWHLFGTFHH